MLIGDRSLLHKCNRDLSPISIFHFKVARVGVEPTRCCHRQILSLMRLPIPPSRHTFLIVPE